MDRVIYCAAQDRLDAKAKEFKAERAMMAESEIMRMEVGFWQFLHATVPLHTRSHGV